LHHGWMSVESQPGRGSTFHIYLPVSTPTIDQALALEDDRKLPVVSGAALPALARLLLKPIANSGLINALNDLALGEPEGSMLIVEDDPQTRRLHRRLIAAHFPRYSIHEAGNGQAALDMLARETPSLIMLDLVMPEVDGFTVLEAVRANPRTMVVPVLVLSGRALSSAEIRRLSAARVTFQTKDVLSDPELAEALRRMLSHDSSLPLHTSALVKQAIAFIQQHYHEPITLQELADTLGVSKNYLGRIFHQEVGLTPWEYLIRYRVLRAKELLLTTGATVAEVAARVGFDTATYFNRIFQREVGCSPRAFRAQPAQPAEPDTPQMG
jgi:AraC-like DNA-binding protein